MVISIFQLSLHIFISISIYTLVIYFGIMKAKKEQNKDKVSNRDLQSVLSEIKSLLSNKEEFFVSNNHREEDLVNNLTLADFIHQEPTDEDYQEAVEILTEIAYKAFKNYKFFLAKSSDDTQKPHFMQITSYSKEEPYLHKKVFKIAVDKGLDMHELQKRFAKEVEDNRVVPVGKKAKVITDDNTGQLPTGVSPIQSGLEDADIHFIISFVGAESYQQWKENTFGNDKDE